MGKKSDKVETRRKAAPKKVSVEPQKRCVLVGTYKGRQLEDWRGWYNYPIDTGNDEWGTGDGRPLSDDANFSQINELWLFKGTKEQKVYRAEFVGVKTREELIRDYGYPAKGKAHGGKYLLFKTEFKYRHKLDDPLDCDRVIIRTKDFATAPKVRKQLKAYLESPDRKNPDLAKRLPSIITRLRPEQLRVCEAAVQMDLLQWEPAVGMSPLLGKIESIVMSIGEFGRAYSLSSSDAYVYLKKYKGLAYLEDCHEPLSCLPMESLVDDLAQVCRNNGGKLK
jgi:hypothetical protein